MKIQPVSDLHMQEFDTTQLREIAGVEADVCIIAGDVYNYASTFMGRSGWLSAFLEEHSPKGKLYIIGPGNHDYYRSNKSQMDRMLGECLKRRVPLLGPKVTKEVAATLPAGVVFANPRLDIMFLGVRFLYTPGWWDGSLFPRRPGIDENVLTDELLIYDMIESNYGMDWGTEEREWLDEATDKHPEVPCVVATHSAPCYKSAHPKYAGWKGNCFFVNNWPDLLSKPNVVLWHHGHTHTAFEYTEENCHVVCNPRGYRADGANYRPNLVLDLKELTPK